jgi:uncharacterized membrane protein (UPF0136 family)
MGVVYFVSHNISVEEVCGIVIGFFIMMILQIFSKRRLPGSSNMIPLCLSVMVVLVSYYRFTLDSGGLRALLGLWGDFSLHRIHVQPA